MFQSLCLSWLLFGLRTFAQSSCEGETSTYSQNGLTVPFNNLCGKDITATVDFQDPTNEPTWSDCLNRCVEKAPLCFGFDFNFPGSIPFNCWLMNASFPESSAVLQPYTVDAAMLDPDFVSGLSSDCRVLGLWGCFQKNGQLEAETETATAQASSATSSLAPSTTESSSTLATTSSTTTWTTASGITESTTEAAQQPQSDSGGLSTGAKAGIGAGVGIGVLLIGLIGGYFLLKRRRQRSEDVGGTTAPPHSPPYAPEKAAGYEEPYQHRVAELQGHQGPYGTSELPSPPFSHMQQPQQPQVYEVDGSGQYRRY